MGEHCPRFGSTLSGNSWKRGAATPWPPGRRKLITVLDQITPLILTYNEAPNIARTLAGLSWAKEIVVVDSFSDDETVEIARSFPQVRVVQTSF